MKKTCTMCTIIPVSTEHVSAKISREVWLSEWFHDNVDPGSQ